MRPGRGRLVPHRAAKLARRAICGFAGRHVRGLLRAGGGKTAAAAGAGAAGCGAAAGLCGGPGTAYGSCRCTCTALPVAAGGACLFCLCGGTGRLCAKPQLPRFPLGGCGRAAMALQRTYDDTAILDEFILEVENEGRLRFGPGAEGVRPAEPQDAARTLCCRRWTPRVCCSGRTARWCPRAGPFPPGCCRCRWPSPGRTAFEWGGRKPTLPAKAAAGRFPAGPLRKNSPLSSGCNIPEEGGLFAFRVLPDKAAAAVKESAFALHLCCAR